MVARNVSLVTLGTTVNTTALYPYVEMEGYLGLVTICGRKVHYRKDQRSKHTEQEKVTI